MPPVLTDVASTPHANAVRLSLASDYSNNKSAESLDQLIEAQRQQQITVDAGMAQMRSEMTHAQPSTLLPDWSLPTLGFAAVCLITLVLMVRLVWAKHKRPGLSEPVRGSQLARAASESPHHTSLAGPSGVSSTPGIPNQASVIDLALPTQEYTQEPALGHQSTGKDTEQALMETASSWMGEVGPLAHVDTETITSWDTSLLLAKEYEKLGQWEEAVSIYEQAIQLGDATIREKAHKFLLNLMPGA